MPAKSKQQFKFMQAAAHGDVKDGPSPEQAKEFVKGQSPKGLPKKVKPKAKAKKRTSADKLKAGYKKAGY